MTMSAQEKLVTENTLVATSYFRGDKDGPERILSDRFVTCRKSGNKCFHCNGSIIPGGVYESVALIWGGFLHTRICLDCVVALNEDDWEIGESRLMLY